MREDPWELVPPIASWMPGFDYTLGPEVAEVATMAGFEPDPEQRLILDAVFAVSGGKSAARDVGVCAPRQNLKTGSLEQMCLGWVYVLEVPLVTWTAHLTDTATKSWEHFRLLVESHPDLEAELDDVRSGKGDQALIFSGGRRVEFRARTHKQSRGATGNRVVMDEAMYVEGYHLGAMAPTLRAVPDPQLVFAGSAGFAASHVWRSLRDRGRAGGDRFLSWWEWASDLEPGGCEVEGCRHGLGTPGCALDDDERLLRSNSALGRRIDLDSLHADRLTIPPAQYAVETLGWWETPVGASLGVNLERWNAPEISGGLLDPSSRRAPDGAVAIAFDIDPERTQGSIGLYALREDGLGHTELIQHEYGVAWMVPRLLELVSAHRPVAVVVGSQAPAAALAPDLIKAGVEVRFASQSDYARACGAYRDAVDAASMRHRGQPLLTASVGAVTRKPVGSEGAFIWNRVSGADITAAVAATLARWGYIATLEETVKPTSIFFLGSLECDECDCPASVPDGDFCTACQHVHSPIDDDESEDA